MNKPKVFLDLDRTLFDTDSVLQLWDELSKHYDIDPSSCKNEREEYYVWSDDMYCYDFFAHVQARGIDAEESYSKLQHSSLGDGRFELPHSEQLVEWLKSRNVDLALLTYGTDDYQRLKAALCPSLKGIPVITTLKPKRDVLQNAGECWLVDDKDLGVDPPENVHLVQVVVPGGSLPKDKPWPVCMNLKEVKEYLDGKMY